MIRGIENEKAYEFYEQTKNGNCDKNCKSCILFVEEKQMCMHKKIALLEKWQQLQHEKFRKELQNG